MVRRALGGLMNELSPGARIWTACMGLVLQVLLFMEANVAGRVGDCQPTMQIVLLDGTLEMSDATRTTIQPMEKRMAIPSWMD
jgi:hypothetical protein